ncbi:hypothetical protein [Modestobacter sp. SYSU DS0511]
MSQSIRPLPVPGPTSPAAEAAHRDRDLRRLLSSWLAASSRLISAQAHGGADERELLDAVVAIEEALRSRHPEDFRVIETGLHLLLLQAEHTGDPLTRAADCLTCRRLGDGPPVTVAQLLQAELPR